MYSLIIHNARVARADGSTVEADIACARGIIERIEPAVDAAAEESVDAQGRLVLPGVIDPQVHFRDPGATDKEDLESGSRAAVKGGVTAFLEMPNTRPPTISQQALDAKLARAASVCVANYGFFIGATPDNLDAINSAAPVCGIKVFMGSSTGSLLVHEQKDLERIFANGERLIAVHAEDEQRIRLRTQQFGAGAPMEPRMHSRVRDRECALRATERALALSQKHRRRLHVLHLSTADEVALLRRHKPAWVTAEAIPNHLFLNENDYERLGTCAQMNPPLRTAKDNEALWQGLIDGVIDFIATDHAPHSLADKARPYPASPSGMPGVETSLPLLLTEMAAGRCTLAQIQRWMCAGPAEAYRIRNKGTLAEGWDADLTVVDIERYRPVVNAEMFTRVGWSPFAGRELTGWPVYTVVGGRVAFDNGHIREGVRGRPLEFA